MKLAILLSVVALCAARSTRNSGISDDVTELIRSYGYPAESYKLQTADGYILYVIRIPGGRLEKTKKQSEESQSTSSGSQSSQEGDKQAVVLMHGLMGSAEDFVVGGPEEGLAFHLADQGFDVFIANGRGSAHGREHTVLDPMRDDAFWRFSWHEIGVKDLPAIIDNVLLISGDDKIHFVGHMEGTTAFFVCASELPKYNDKIEKMIALGPIAYLQNSENEIISKIADIFKEKDYQAWISKNLGENVFTPSEELVQDLETKCINEDIEERVCKNHYFLVNGYNSQHLNETTINKVLKIQPTHAATRELVHYAQIKSSGRFQKFKPDYTDGQETEEYDLTKVTVPIVILNTPNDIWSHEDDVEKLVGKLPNVSEPINLDDLTNNLDLIYSKDVDKVNKKIVEMMQEESKNNL